MLTLGLSGFFNSRSEEVVPGLPRGGFHDASAVLLQDGEMVVGLEQERLDRLKHSNHFPLEAIKACLDYADVSLREIDRIAYFFDEHFLDLQLGEEFSKNPLLPIRSPRQLIVELLGQHFGHHVDPAIIQFVKHHRAHAASTYFDSGWSRGLVAVFDGAGEDESGSLYEGEDCALTRLVSYPVSESLGFLYAAGTEFLGFGLFDEYKVMGLSSSGDWTRYWPVFASLIALREEGQFHANFRLLRRAFLESGMKPRRSDESVAQMHRDFAAGLQRGLETIMIHVLEYWQRVTRQDHLCLAGGVAQNSKLNGVLVEQGIFEKVFVHPAAHDAGAGYGAAMWTAATAGELQPARGRLRSVAWGPNAIDEDDLIRLLTAWRCFVTYEQPPDICAHTAACLADGSVVGWVQGRSEFGPRALGNRSILADPRPEENRDRINGLVKRRESFRPFAPSVIEEAVSEYFSVRPSIADPEFMSFVVPVLPHRQSDLRAVTHVDGSARVQVVRRKDSPLFWQLLHAFGELTGIPVLLNTSFNNYAEPIVQSGEDAMRCFLTTGLDRLAIGPYIVRKNDADNAGLETLVPRICAFAVLEERLQWNRGSAEISHVLGWRHVGHERQGGLSPRHVSAQVYDVLTAADGKTKLTDLVGGTLAETVRTELLTLWADRLIDMVPFSVR